MLFSLKPDNDKLSNDVGNRLSGYFFPYPLTIFIIMHASPSLHHTKVVSFFLTIKLKPQEEKKSTKIKHQSS